MRIIYRQITRNGGGRGRSAAYRRLLGLLSAGLLAAGLSGAGALAAQEKDKSPRSYTVPLPPKPDFSALNWLVGEWTGHTTDKAAPGDVHISVAYALDQQYMVFNEWMTLPATKTAPATRESRMGILSASPAGPGFVFESYSSTGFITRYRVLINGTEAQFVPDGGDQPAPGWLFRRTLAPASEDSMTETVQVAPPGKAFFDYYTARLSRVLPPPAAPPTSSGPSADPASQAPLAKKAGPHN